MYSRGTESSHVAGVESLYDHTSHHDVYNYTQRVAHSDQSYRGSRSAAKDSPYEKNLRPECYDHALKVFTDPRSREGRDRHSSTRSIADTATSTITKNTAADESIYDQIIRHDSYDRATGLTGDRPLSIYSSMRRGERFDSTNSSMDYYSLYRDIEGISELDVPAFPDTFGESDQAASEETGYASSTRGGHYDTMQNGFADHRDGTLSPLRRRPSFTDSHKLLCCKSSGGSSGYSDCLSSPDYERLAYPKSAFSSQTFDYTCETTGNSLPTVASGEHI